MVGVHCHDCYIENGVIFANQATLGGHVHVENNAVIGGLSAVHQFCEQEVSQWRTYMSAVKMMSSLTVLQ